MSKYISIYGGSRAVSLIRETGFSQDMVKIVAAAAGGPKWLILGAFDRILFPGFFRNRKTSLFLVGSSAGAWRLAAACQNRPDEALEKFRHGYIHQWYSLNPGHGDILFECRRILSEYLNAEAVDEILMHPLYRLNILSVRSRGLLKSENTMIQASGLFLSALSNMVKREFLKYFFDRVLFYHPEEKPPFYNMNRFPTHKVALDKNNFHKAILSSGSIPIIMPGVDNIAGAPSGVYRDGGIIDYHMDIPFLPENDDQGLVLFPHYSDKIIPGWLDKTNGRLPGTANMKNLIMISPTRAFVDLLPGKKIPDRSDFSDFKGNNRERIARWKKACTISRLLGDELFDLIDSNRVAQCIKPLKTAP